MRWSVYAVRYEGKPPPKMEPLGYVNALNQPAALAAAWEKWPGKVDPSQTQAGFTVRKWENDPCRRKHAMNIDQQIGARIREQRKTRRWSQSKLADAVGVTFQQIQKYENGVNRCSASRLYQIVKALGVPVQDFFPR